MSLLSKNIALDPQLSFTCGYSQIEYNRAGIILLRGFMFRKYAQKNDIINVIFLLCLLPFVFVGLGFFYIVQLEISLRESLEETMLDNGLDAAHTASLRMENSFRRLEGIADSPILSDEHVSLNIKMDLLRKEAQKYGWDDILIALGDGRTQSSSGRTMNVSRRNYFAKALQGNSAYSSILNSPLYDHPIVAHAVPLMNDYMIVGALIAIEKASDLHFTVDSRISRHDNIKTQFMDDNGVLITGKRILNERFYSKLAQENNLNKNEILNLMAEHENFDHPLIYNGQESYIVTNFIGRSGWSVITVITTEEALGKLNEIIYLSAGIMIAMTVLLAGYIIYLLRIRKTYQHQSHIAQTALHVEGIFYVSIDNNSKILYSNEILNNHLGLEPNSNTRLTDFFDGVQIDALFILLNSKAPFVLPLIAPSGNKIYIQWNILPSNEKDSWRMLGIDVSAHHHKVEVELAQSHNNELQQIIDTLHSPVMMHAIGGGILMANTSAKELLGAEDLNELYASYKKGVGESVARNILITLNNVVETGKNLMHTITFTKPSGEKRTFQTILSPLFDEQGKAHAAVSLSTDITDSVDLQKKLEDEISRLQAILESCPAGVFFSKNSIVQYCNPAAQEMSGVYNGGPTPLGKDMVEGDTQTLIKNFTSGIDTYNAPFTIRDQQDNLRNLLITAIGVTWQDERMNVMWALDVTKMHKIQEELMLARDVAESATQAKSDFLATMSHEIRTPMNAILGFLHLFDRNNLSQKQNSYIEKITISATGLLRIINDILDFSKIEANKMNLEYAPFSLETSINAIHSIMSFTANEKGLSLTNHIDEDVPTVIIGDRERLNQILLNLLGNAIKFTHSGSISIDVKVQKIVDDAHMILDFIVTDTGIGLSEEQAAKLFQPFTQADTSTSRRFGGTGLGLVISTRLAELMGGNISLESKLGEGSKFTCSILAKVDKTIDAENLANVNANNFFNGKEYTQIDLGVIKGKRVLLVEDNMINQEIAAALLEDYELALDFADNGQEAIEKVKDKEYDLILMDIQMPVMDGLQATRHIRSMVNERPYVQTLPIIAMTANVMAEDKQRCSEAGMDAHIAKPISPPELRNTLIRWLHK